GIVWPLIAIFVTRCELRPEVDCVHEDQPCRMRLSVTNHFPLPVWGLAVEGFLDREAEEVLPTVALACVPPVCTSEYSITVHPELRGHYPIETPKVACSFPFGIWTARRRLGETKTLTVWPKVFRISGVCPIRGRRPSELGDGQRGGRSGDFVGVRDYRRGDSTKHIHWAASARTDSLVVVQRGGPECVQLDVVVDTRIAEPTKNGLAPDPNAFSARQLLADRIRVAASVLLNLHQSNIPMRVTIGSRALRLSPGAQGRRQILDALASVPNDGESHTSKSVTSTAAAAIQITTDSAGQCIARITDPQGGRRAGGQTVCKTFASGPDLAETLHAFWTEVRDADVAA
ncbi:MAG: DUF58 domain-containing protein, partial [Planctomycetota bacterium]